MQRLTSACSVLMVVLLLVCIYMLDRLSERDMRQSYTGGGVTTERGLGEPMDRWHYRHMEAERRFNQ